MLHRCSSVPLFRLILWYIFGQLICRQSYEVLSIGLVTGEEYVFRNHGILGIRYAWFYLICDSVAGDEIV